MREALREQIGKSRDPKDVIIERVLRRSLLEPSEKTIFDSDEDRFVIVDPKIRREDVDAWAALP